MAVHVYLAYLLACFLIVIVPGPTVTVVIANSLTHGTRAGLFNVLGTQIGLTLIVGILAIGLAPIVATMGWWFAWVRLAGAAYLIWIGWKLLRSSGRREDFGRPAAPRGGFVLQGVLVILSNPKALLFFGALIPQFVDPGADAVRQIVLLGGTFMAVATLCDGAYAVLTGRAGVWLTARRIRFVSRLSGAMLIGGGAWLALMRAK